MLRVSLRQILNPQASEENATFYHQYAEFLTLRPEQLTIQQFVELTNLVNEELEYLEKNA